MLQTLAGALTAITVTYLMSFLGVAGTVIGVGLVSVLTVLGNFMYSSAMHSAKEKVARVQPKPRSHSERSAPAAPSAVSERSSPQAHSPARAASAARGEDSSGRWGRIWSATVQRYGRKRIFGSIALVFVLLAGTVTVIELSAGRPLADIVRNEDSSGTTFFGGAAGGDAADTEEDIGEVPPPEDEGVVEDPAVPEAPPEEAPAPVEEPPQQEPQPAPEEEAPQQ